MIKLYDTLPLGVLAHAWEFYQDVFTTINALAVQRHKMTSTEFYDVATDKRVSKWVSTELGPELMGESVPLITGLGVQTDDLDAWPLISPEYFKRKWPDAYADKRIFYTGFVGVHPEAPINTFRNLLDDMIKPIIAVRGVAIMDFCATNVDGRRLPHAVDRILGRLTPVVEPGTVIDRQEFWAYDFGALTSD